MYCGKCGKPMPDEEVICPSCGADMTLPPKQEEKPGFLRRLLDRLAGK